MESAGLRQAALCVKALEAELAVCQSENASLVAACQSKDAQFEEQLARVISLLSHSSEAQQRGADTFAAVQQVDASTQIAEVCFQIQQHSSAMMPHFSHIHADTSFVGQM